MRQFGQKNEEILGIKRIKDWRKNKRQIKQEQNVEEFWSKCRKFKNCI